jgi:hypothetical protein
VRMSHVKTLPSECASRLTLACDATGNTIF